MNKTCTKCGIEKPATPEYFFRNKNISSGLSSECKKCLGIRNRSYYMRPENHKRLNEYSRKWKDSKVGQNSRLKSGYGLTLEKFDQILEEQSDVCKICGRVNVSGKRLHVDHDHKTGKVRGLLCSKCNTTIGLVGENISILQKIIIYLGENDV